MQRSREPLSAVDLAWLRMERPTNLMTVVIVLTFSTRLRYERLHAVLLERLLRFERFRQRPVHDVLGSRWESDPGFDMGRHLCRLALRARAGQAQLEAAAGELASTPLDPLHPLWQIHLVERYRKGSALVARFHHCYADGMALLRVFLSLTDTAEQGTAAARPAEPDRAHAAGTQSNDFTSNALSLLRQVTQGTLDLASASLRAIAHPERTLDTAKQLAAATGELAAIALLSDDPTTPLKGALGTRKRLAWVEPLPLAEIKTVAAALGCTINDVLLSCVAGGLGTLLANRGCAVQGVRALVPVNLRAAEDEATLGNHFGLVFVDLPVNERNPLGRVFAIHQNMQQRKHSEQAAASLLLLNVLGSLPAPLENQSIDFLASKASLVISNVPGPRTTLYLAGARIEQQFFWVPQAGSLGLGISLLSYQDRVHCGVMSDANLSIEPGKLASCFREEFERLLLHVLVGPLAAVDSAAASASP